MGGGAKLGVSVFCVASAGCRVRWGVKDRVAVVDGELQTTIMKKGKCDFFHFSIFLSSIVSLILCLLSLLGEGRVG